MCWSFHQLDPNAKTTTKKMCPHPKHPLMAFVEMMWQKKHDRRRKRRRVPGLWFSFLCVHIVSSAFCFDIFFRHHFAGETHHRHEHHLLCTIFVNIQRPKWKRNPQKNTNHTSLTHSQNHNTHPHNWYFATNTFEMINKKKHIIMHVLSNKRKTRKKKHKNIAPESIFSSKPPAPPSPKKNKQTYKR